MTNYMTEELLNIVEKGFFGAENPRFIHYRSEVLTAKPPGKDKEDGENYPVGCAVGALVTNCIIIGLSDGIHGMSDVRLINNDDEIFYYEGNAPSILAKVLHAPAEYKVRALEMRIYDELKEEYSSQVRPRF